METNATLPAAVCYLTRPEGRLAYEVVGEGPTVICAPGMGELRSAYRFLAPSVARRGLSSRVDGLAGSWRQ